MTFWQRVESKFQNKEVSSWVSWLSMFIKVVICKIPEVLNWAFYKRPQWKSSSFRSEIKEFRTLKHLAEIYESQFQFDDRGNFIYAKGWDGIDNIGDQTLMNGIYSAYYSIFWNGNYFNKYYVKNQLEKKGNKIVLFRGRNSISYRDDPSGDQLTGILWAYSEEKSKKLNFEMEKFLQQFLEDKILWNTKGESSPLGNFKPNLITINGDCAIWLAACVVARRYDLFLKYYFDYGYGKMLPYASVYLLDDRYKLGKRNWFSCNISMIALCVLLKELYVGSRNEGFMMPSHVYRNLKNSIMKILNNNKHNLFFWLLAVHYNIIDKNTIPKEALEYFDTFRIIKGREVLTPTSYEVFPPEEYSGSLMPLGLYGSAWVWEREPYKILLENKWISRLDMVFTQKLRERYL